MVCAPLCSRRAKSGAQCVPSRAHTLCLATRWSPCRVVVHLFLPFRSMGPQMKRREGREGEPNENGLEAQSIGNTDSWPRVASAPKPHLLCNGAELAHHGEQKVSGAITASAGGSLKSQEMG